MFPIPRFKHFVAHNFRNLLRRELAGADAISQELVCHLAFPVPRYAMQTLTLRRSASVATTGNRGWP